MELVCVELVMLHPRTEAFCLVVLPILIIAILAVIALILRDLNASYSVLLGGFVWGLPQLYFAVKILANKAGTPTQWIWRFYRAELFKLFLSAVLFIVVLKFLPVASLFVLAAYLIAQLTFWLATLFYLGLSKR